MTRRFPFIALAYAAFLLAAAPPVGLGAAIITEYDAALDLAADASWSDLTNDEVLGNTWTLDSAATASAAATSRVGITHAFSFDADGTLAGSVTGADTGSFASLDSATPGSVAFEMWLRPRRTSDDAFATLASDLAGRDELLFETGGTNGAALKLNGGDLEFHAKDLPAPLAFTVPDAMLGDFIQVIGVIDGQAGQARLYVNGQARDNSGANAVGNWKGGDESGLARGEQTLFVTGDAFTGDIARVRMLGGVVGDGEAQTLYDDVATDGPANSNDYYGILLTDGAARSYRFDETPGATTAADSASFTDGSYQGNPNLGVPALVPGSAGTAAQFDGVDDVVDSFSGDAFTGTMDSVSIELWFATDDAEKTQAILDTGGSNAIQIIIEDDGVASDGSGILKLGRLGGGAPDTLVEVAIESGETYHVVLVMDNEDLIDAQKGVFAYVDGALAAFDDTVAADINAGNPTVIGAFNGNGDGGGFFDGVLDDLSIYNRVLTADQVALHAQGAVPEPASLALLTLGAAALLRRRK